MFQRILIVIIVFRYSTNVSLRSLRKQKRFDRFDGNKRKFYSLATSHFQQSEVVAKFQATDMKVLKDLGEEVILTAAKIKWHPVVIL